MSQSHVILEESFAVPPEVLFDALLDHAGMTDWVGTRISVVRGPGDGGVGTVRRIHLPFGTIDEQVTYVQRPRRIVYRIVRGLPIVRFHRGEILVEPWGQTGCQLTWDIRIDSVVPGVASAICAVTARQMRTGLTKLRTQLAFSQAA